MFSYRLPCFFLNHAKSGFAWSNYVINRLVHLISSVIFGLMIQSCVIDVIRRQYRPAHLHVCLRPFFSRVISFTMANEILMALRLLILVFPNTLVYLAFYFMNQFAVGNAQFEKEHASACFHRGRIASSSFRAHSTFSARLRGIISTEDNNKLHTTPRIEVQINTVRADDCGNDEVSLQRDEKSAVARMQSKSGDFKFPSNESSDTGV
ncbi:hypothetical protein DFS33DRAFT_9594 [Desarmillaria ectypa]|nr:hypothetical protein DFS33DRAFT_9594 [Desarmillaria ectypa]